MNVLMTGVSPDTRGGMWSVAQSELDSSAFRKETNCTYIPTATRGSLLKKIRFAFFALCKVFFYLLFHRPDLIHCHMSERGSVARKRIVLELSRLFGCKTVLHLHGAELEQWYRNSPVLVKCFVRTTLHRADLILLLGDYWRPFMRELGVEDRCRVLHNGVECLEENHRSSAASGLLFLGEVGERKGAFDLLEAFRLALPDLPEETDLFFYGPGDLEEMRERIRLYELQDRVFCPGWLGKDEKPKVFSKTAVHVLPSYHEGLPMSILETMAAGIPNIATDIAAVPEVIDGSNGVLVTPGDVTQLATALTKLMRNETERSILSEAAFQSIQKGFSVETHVKQLMEYYREMI